MNEETKKLRESLDKMQQTLANTTSSNPQQDAQYKHMCDMMSSMRQYLYAIEDDMYAHRQKHSQGHMPPIKGAGKMKQILKKLDLDQDYDVNTPVISVASTKNGLVIEAEYRKNGDSK